MCPIGATRRARSGPQITIPSRAEQSRHVPPVGRSFGRRRPRREFAGGGCLRKQARPAAYADAAKLVDGLTRRRLLHRLAKRSSARQEVRRRSLSPKRYDMLARIELAPVPCRLLLAWERGCLAAPSAASLDACNFVKGELWLAGGRNVWVFRPTPRTRESSTRIPCCWSCPPSRCQRGYDHSTFGSPFGRDRRVMTIPAARSAAAEALAS